MMLKREHKARILKMDRRSTILAGIRKEDLVLEIAPWFTPLAAKCNGYNVKVIDIFDRAALIARARKDPAISPDTYDFIEEVDFVGSATELSALIPTDLHGKFDYIISSHNFEHLPNPIKFLQGCELLLKPGGLVSMAIPDARACFDYFRPHTTIGDWLQAYFENRQKPSAKQVFDLAASRAVARLDGGDTGAFWAGISPDAVRMTGDIRSAFQAWQQAADTEIYQDTHCTVMSPSSLELLLMECRQLELTALDVETIAGPVGCEFFVRLRNAPLCSPNKDWNALRSELTRKIWSERAAGQIPVKTIDDARGNITQMPTSTDSLAPAERAGSKVAGRFRKWCEQIALGR